MGLLLAVDPGLRGCGVALFRGGRLEQAAYVDGLPHAQRAQAWTAMVGAVVDFVGARALDYLAIELPQVYVASRSKGDPNDLIQLAAVVGGLCLAFEAAQQRVYLPAEWKGQAPKEVIHGRVDKRLNEDEAAAISCRRKGLLHNVKDAVGIGLVFLGRL